MLHEPSSINQDFILIAHHEIDGLLYNDIFIENKYHIIYQKSIGIRYYVKK